MFPLPVLFIKGSVLYDPFRDQEWELTKEGLQLFSDMLSGTRKYVDLDDQEKQYFSSLEEEGLILTHPKIAYWFLTLKCSLSCTHCYQNIISQETQLSWKETNLIVERLFDWGVEHLSLSGGDIFLNPHFYKLLHTIEEKRTEAMTVSLLTNGFILAGNKKAQQELLAFKKWKPYLQISLYSANPKIHDGITTIPGSFEKTIESIRFLQEHNFPILLNTVLMKENFDGRYELIQFIEEELKVPREHFNFSTLLFPYAGQNHKEVTKYSITSKQLQQLFVEEEFRALPAKYLHNSSHCTGCRTKIAISPQGNLFPCNMVQEVLGNVLDQSIDEVLNNRQSIDFKDYLNSECAICPTKFCKKCQAFTSRDKFDTMYCQYIKIAEKEVTKRIKSIEKKGFKELRETLL